MKKLLSVTLSIFMLVCLTITGSAITDGVYTYEISNDEATILECNDYSAFGTLILPDKLGGYPLVHIGDSAIHDLTQVTAIKFPNTVKTIGARSFMMNAGLTSIEIPNSVISIGDNTFSGCSNIERIVLPDGLEKIGYLAFSSTAYYRNGDNWENNALYIGKHLISLKNKFEGDYTIKSGTLTIADSAFERCSKLTSVTLPDSIKNIGSTAFKNCQALTNISIPASVLNIYDDAFTGSAITDIYYAGNKSDWDKIKIGESNDLLFNATVHFADGSTSSVEQTPDGITVKVNGSKVIFDQPPVLESGRTLVPLRAIFEALGASIGWDDATQTVTATKDEIEISLQIGSDKMYVNEDVKTLDVPAKLISSRTMVPVRAISEAFGCNVDWVDATQTVVITQ